MRPAVAIIGGYNSFWPSYLRMARHLQALTGLQTVGVPVMLWDWQKAVRAGDATNLLQKLDETVKWMRRRLRADRAILVGHSAGGLVARLYLCDQPVWGHVYNGVEHVTAMITLGTPHCCNRQSQIADEGVSNWFLVDMANRAVPDAPFANHVHYRTVAGRHILGRLDGDASQRRAFRNYQLIGVHGEEAWGDGMVPVDCAHLKGAENLVLDGVAHSRRYGAGWYGATKDIMRSWWPNSTAHGL